MADRAKAKHTAAPANAAYLFQLERALHHLATASSDASVAVEHIDDVSVSEGRRILVQEQDKHTVRVGAEMLADRSLALWRTLQIWVAQRREGVMCERYLIAVNSPVTTPIATMLKQVSAGKLEPAAAVEALREAGKRPSKTRKPSQLQARIDDVLQESDADLSALIAAIEIVDAQGGDAWRPAVVHGMAIDPGVDAAVVLDSLFGWLASTLRMAWEQQQPGVVSRLACVRQCREIERRQARQRLLPRPAAEVRIEPGDRTKAMTRPFVHHLYLIEAADDDVLQAVDHFIQFGTEKYRLAQ